jgi:hypothetical protein
MRTDASRLSAMGFSERTSRPYSRARSTTCSWSAGGTTTVQKSAGRSSKARRMSA